MLACRLVKKGTNKGMSLKLTEFFRTPIVTKTSERLLMKQFFTITINHNQFCNATWFFPLEIQLFKLSLKSDEGSVGHPLPDVNKLNLKNIYKKEVTLQ